MSSKPSGPVADLAWPRAARGLVAALAVALPVASRAGCNIARLELPVKMVGGRPITTVGINGTPVRLLVDSGAFFSFLTEGTAAQLKLRLHRLPEGMELQGVAGRIDAKMTTVDHLQLAKGDIPQTDFIVGGNEIGAGAMGLMGRNILAFADTEYDLAHGVIRFVSASDECDKANMAYWAGETPVSIIELLPTYREPRPAIRANLLVNGHELVGLFDTGATTAVSLGAARKVGVKEADMTAGGEMAGAGRGKVDSWTAKFERVEIGDETLLHNRLEVGDFSMRDADMLVGVDFFLSHHIYVSQKRHRMFFTYNGGPVFALNKVDEAARAAAAASAATAQAMTADELARRGAASQTRGDFAAALADLDRACAMEPDNAGFLATRGVLHDQMKDAAKALADFDAALRRDPELADARLRRAWIHAIRDERDLALQDLAFLDTSLPPQSPLRANMAGLYSHFEMPRPMLAQWNLWIAAHPHDIALEDAHNGRCWARVVLGIELDQALDDCDAAVNVAPKNASFLDSRAWVYLRQGKPNKALADFDRGLAIRADGAWSLYGRGLAHLGLGDAQRGQADLAAARKLNPHIDADIQRSGLPTAPAIPR
jgi:tetratricopeptide (TPR) repeat protein/predicted aspartyl protease